MTEVEELEEQATELKEMIEFSKSIRNLESNPDFNKVIIEGYCQKEMARNLGLAVSDKLNPETRELCNQLAKSPAALKNYLVYQMQRGEAAEEDLALVEQHLEELRAKGE